MATQASKNSRNQPYLEENTPTTEKRKISVAIKMKILNDFQKGKSLSHIAESYQIPKSTLKHIWSNRGKIEQCAQNISSQVATKIIRPRNSAFHKLETLLFMWIVDQKEKGVALSETIIRQKALSLFGHLKSEFNSDCNFLASHGWFEKFRARHQLKSGHLYGGSSNAASSDSSAVVDYTEKFNKLITKGGYSPRHVFNVHETRLLWKELPKNSFFTHDKQLHALSQKPQFTLLLGGNANGDVKLSPWILYSNQTYIGKTSVPVTLRYNAKAMLTKSTFSEWFTCYFVPFVKNYTKRKNIDHKALLILDNSPGHPTNLNDIYPHIKVVYLPPNTTSCVQPMDQGICSMFKSYYLKIVMNKIVQLNGDNDKNVFLYMYLKKYNVESAAKNIYDAWSSISQSAMAGAWKKLWPEIVPETVDKDGEDSACNEEIVELSNNAAFEEITIEDVQAYSGRKHHEISNEELVEFEHDSLMSKNVSGTNVKLMKIINMAEGFKEAVVDYEESDNCKKTVCAVIDGLLSKYRKHLVKTV